jgi:hypothetical protein
MKIKKKLTKLDLERSKANEIRKLQQQIKRSLNVEKDWGLFKMYFEQVSVKS